MDENTKTLDQDDVSIMQEFKNQDLNGKSLHIGRTINDKKLFKFFIILENIIEKKLNNNNESFGIMDVINSGKLHYTTYCMS